MNDAKEIIKILNEHGEAYIVGGTVRDTIINKENDDIDIATNVPMSLIEETFETIDIGKNKDFGVCVVRYNNKSYEIAHFRTDGEYSDGRHPDSVELTSSLKEDVLRRDFTINGLAMDIDGNIIDYVDGKDDIKLGLIRTIGDPDKRFKEDYLRMLRAIRFAATLNFKIEIDTLDAIKENAHNIKFISAERIYKELYKMASCSGFVFAKAILLLKKTNLLRHILPEIDEMDQYEHTIETHPEGDVFDHTLAALKYNQHAVPECNFSILFHDVGKIVTQTFNENDTVCYYGHGSKGVPLAEEICHRLRIPNDMKKCIIFSMKNHMIVPLFKEMKRNKILNLINDVNWDTLYNTCLADDMSRFVVPDYDVDSHAAYWIDLDIIIDTIKKDFIDNQKFNKIKSIINGNLIMNVLNIPPGPTIGIVQRDTMDWVINNKISTEDIISITSYIKSIA